MKQYKDLSFEEKLLVELSRLNHSVSSLNSLGTTLERLYQDWKYPVSTIAEQMAPQWKEQEESNRAEKQLKTVERQNKILVVTIIINAVISIIVALIQTGIIKIN